MIPIRNYKPRVISFYRYHHRFTIGQWINVLAIYNSPYLQEAKKYLVLSLKYYVKRCRNT